MASISNLFRSLYGGSLGARGAAVDAARQNMQLEQAQLENQNRQRAQEVARISAINDILNQTLQTGVKAYESGQERAQQKSQFETQAAMQKARDEAALTQQNLENQRALQADAAKKAQLAGASVAMGLDDAALQSEVLNELVSPDSSIVPLPQQVTTVQPQGEQATSLPMPSFQLPAPKSIADMQPKPEPIAATAEDKQVQNQAIDTSVKETQKEIKGIQKSKADLENRISQYEANLANNPAELAAYKAAGGADLLRFAYMGELENRRQNAVGKIKVMMDLKRGDLDVKRFQQELQAQANTSAANAKKNMLEAVGLAAKAVKDPGKLNEDQIQKLAQQFEGKGLSQLEVLAKLRESIKDETFQNTSRDLTVRLQKSNIAENYAQIKSLENKPKIEAAQEAAKTKAKAIEGQVDAARKDMNEAVSRIESIRRDLSKNAAMFDDATKKTYQDQIDANQDIINRANGFVKDTIAANPDIFKATPSETTAPKTAKFALPNGQVIDVPEAQWAEAEAKGLVKQ